MFKFLVEKTHQFSMFNDEGQPGAIDEPVKDFPLIHFLKLSESTTKTLRTPCAVCLQSKVTDTFVQTKCH
jgi:hypothetical protein